VRPLTLEADTFGSSVVLTAIGELDLHTQDFFEQTVTERLASGSVIVDLAQVEFLSITALRSLLVCNEMAAPHTLVYAQAPQQACRLLTVSGVGDQLSLRDTIPALLESEPLAG
jgi:anti-anti-sigma factor